MAIRINQLFRMVSERIISLVPCISIFSITKCAYLAAYFSIFRSNTHLLINCWITWSSNWKRRYYSIWLCFSVFPCVTVEQLDNCWITQSSDKNVVIELTPTSLSFALSKNYFHIKYNMTWCFYDNIQLRLMYDTLSTPTHFSYTHSHP